MSKIISYVNQNSTCIPYAAAREISALSQHFNSNETNSNYFKVIATNVKKRKPHKIS